MHDRVHGPVRGFVFQNVGEGVGIAARVVCEQCDGGDARLDREDARGASGGGGAGHWKSVLDDTGHISIAGPDFLALWPPSSVSGHSAKIVRKRGLARWVPARILGPQPMS